MKKLLVMLMILVLGVSTLMAGGQSEEGQSEKEATTLSVMYTYNQASLGQDARVDAWYKMQEEMISAHPEVNFEFEYVPHDAYQDKIQILAAANELPDVFEVKGSWVKNFVSNNRLMPLNEIMAADKAWSGNYKEGVLKNFTIDGSVYAVSIEGGGTTHVIFYNKLILKEAGYDSFPTEYDDFKDMLQAIAAKGYTPISLGDKSSWVAESCYLSTIGNRMTGSDWTNSITNREGASFTDPQFIKSLDVLAELAEIGAFNADMNSLEYTQQRTPYYNGKAAMFVEGGWAINHVIENALPEILAATGIADFPEVPGQMGADNLNTGGTSGWAIGANSAVADNPDKKELVVEMMKRFSNMENAVKLAETGRTPAMKVTDFDSSALHALNIEYFDYMDKFVPAPTYDLVWDPAVIETLNSGIQMLLIGQVSSEELAESVQKEYTR
ncbi:MULTISPECIES: ABC transporter substrate-binding protein [unclassified Oceanispirochaeta]|uniref:ABC transporter substrate-binding protein n=1 Tax=unclassified Oceanispirochaeta TaxID=2635722 RepID=UPI000E09147E|nr:MULTISPECIES: extracellular solute-binding protein [unclassified Oceanispirochaeta]MBF9016501.1 extracellular solute-binding protein [Oceanispirochaeta sp. M2]NPD72963.1 extracellular solute-binding protein [Oceanispirochaeta sp. M1]RDG31307.1 extracellular solute-binding protein [Oceanispirochaeta sp. M1]